MVQKPSTNFSEQPIASFLDALRSADPAPGGGAAAALTAALGTALVQMVYSINNKRLQNDKNPQVKVMTKESAFSKISDKFAELEKFELLMKLDAEAFAEISKFSKEDRSKPSYQEALKGAAGVPLEIASLAYKAMLLGEEEIERTSRWLASDLAEAGILLEAAFKSARLNVEINLKSIQDKTYLDKVKSELNELEKKVSTSKTKLLGVLNHG